MKSEEYIRKWLNDELSDEERTLFEKSNDFKRLQKLSDALSAFRSPEYLVEPELQKLHEKIDGTVRNEREVRFGWMNTMMKVAAAIIFVVGAYFLFLRNSATIIQTYAGERSEVYLPDSSLVIINAHSKLAFEPKNWSSHREVTLEGEAFFMVRKGSMFDVKTESGKVSVLGTQFNVKVRRKIFEVVCFEGKVKVETSHFTEEIPANNSFMLLNGKVRTSIMSTGDTAPTWINKESSFESIPFNFVIDEFVVQYGVKVETENVDTSKLFTGSFGHDNMELALKAITQPLNISYKRTKDGSILLSGERN